MTKAEIISRIIDRITDPWSDCPENYDTAPLINLQEAEEYLREMREDDDLGDLDPEDRMPDEATPALYMEAYNCYVRWMKHELRVERLAEYIKEQDLVCEYVTYYAPTLDNPVNVFPVDFLDNCDTCPFTLKDGRIPTIIDLLSIGRRSKSSFCQTDEYCWFDKYTGVLHSTDHPFDDKILDAYGFARFILENAEALKYITDNMDRFDIQHIFLCSKDELMKEMIH